MNEDIKVTFDSPEELNIELDAGVIQYGKLQVGTTTTGAAGTKAKVENVGSSGNAILNFTIPRGEKGDRGEKGNKGDAGSIKFIVVAELPTENIDESAIYMKPSSNQEENNTYEEFIYADGKWESIGAAQVKVDLEPYVTKEELNQLKDGETPMGSIVIEDVTCKNLISGFTPGNFYNYVNDVWETDTPFATSDFVNVEVGETYIFSHAVNGVGGYVGCFDENNNFLENLNNDTMLSPFTIINPNCKKIICVAWDPNNNPKVNETWMQLEKGTIATECTPYKKFGYNSQESMGKIIVDDIECKNILPNNIQSQVRNGLTITRNDDGSITLNGTTTSEIYLDIYNNEQGIKLKGDYRFYLFGSSTLNNLQGTINGSNVIYIKFVETAESVVVNYSTETILTRIFTFIAKGSNFDNVTLKYMITKGTNKESYVPYKEFGNNKHIYSIGEQVIGEWLGKTLYRRVFTGTINDTDKWRFLTDSGDIDKKIDTRGFINQGNSGVIVGIGEALSSEDSNLNYATRVIVASNNLRLDCDGTKFANSPYEISIDYTKTTD